MYDIERIRADFPILQRTVHGRPLVYLDNAATTQKPQCVLDALMQYYTCSNANVHRGIHTLAEEATAGYEATRTRVRRFVGARSEREIVFTRGATEAINLVAAAWGRNALRPGDEIVLTQLEHHSNIVPWQLAAQATGAVVRWVPVSGDGSLDMAAAEEVIGPRTRMVAATQMSNVLGTFTPVADLAALAHAHGALLLVDGAQGAAHLPVNVRDLDCDFYVFSAHKLLGPTGVGVLYAREDLLEQMEPYQGGGSMIETVTMEGSTWAELPAKFEAGTPNIADIVAFKAALDYLDVLGMEEVCAHDRELTGYALDRLPALPGVTCFGPADGSRRGGNVAFAVEGIHAHDLASFLDQQGIAIRAGHHCAQPLHAWLGVVATARASFSVYSTLEEIDCLVASVRDAQAYFGTAP